MKHTAVQLDKMTKQTLIDLLLDSETKIENLSAGPLTSDAIKREALELSRRVVEVKKEEKELTLEYQQKSEELKSEMDLKKRELDLKYGSQQGKTADQIEAAYKSLGERAKQAEADLSFGLQKVEIEHSEKVKAIAERTDKLVAENQAKIDASNEEVSKIKQDNQEEISKVKIAQKRQLEEMDYDHKIAVRDKNKTVAEKIADSVGCVVVLKEDWNELKDAKDEEESTILERIETAVANAKSEVYAKTGKEKSDLKNSTDLEIQGLKKDKEYLSKENESLLKRVATLESQVSAFPGQLKDAVEAAKADVTINQDNKK